jgi:hypothetical protein
VRGGDEDTKAGSATMGLTAKGADAVSFSETGLSKMGA